MIRVQPEHGGTEPCPWGSQSGDGDRPPWPWLQKSLQGVGDGGRASRGCVRVCA